MEVYNTKGSGGVPLAFFAMLILLNAYCCGASVLVKTNSTFRCNGGLGECLVADDLELDFVMDSNIFRMLQGISGTNIVTPQTENPNKPVFHCGTGVSYKPCVGQTTTPPPSPSSANEMQKNCNLYGCGL